MLRFQNSSFQLSVKESSPRRREDTLGACTAGVRPEAQVLVRVWPQG